MQELKAKIIEITTWQSANIFYSKFYIYPLGGLLN